MTEIRTPEQQAALDEHVEMTRKASGLPADDGWATPYTETVAEFRQQLMRSSAMYERLHEPHFKVTFEWSQAKHANPDSPPPRPDQVVWDAQMGCMMAGSYAYTLAAVIGFAEKEFGPEVARGLAFIADDLLTNGDFDDLNADVTPAAEAQSENGQPK